ncbi:MAG: NRDE family protein [Deltaproteobacteria bacterium]|nr:NRDE family protein [Deltaproteobacteria bacterium]
MCTLIALHRAVPGVPLVVAANRDEFLARPAEGPAVRELAGGQRVLAPLDLQAGGTWLGVNADGVFAAVTNRPVPELEPERRSRGLVVTDALRSSSAAEAAGFLAALPGGAYNPFNCFVADAERAFACVYQEAPEVSELEAGAHVIGNGEPNDRSHSKIGRILGRAEQAAKMPREGVLDALAEICREHEAGGDPRSDTCVHLGGTGWGGYGTRSSVLLMLADPDSAPDLNPEPGKTGAVAALEDVRRTREAGRLGFGPASRFLSADGAPCEAPYRDFTSLLDELSQRARTAGGEILARKAS